MILDGQAVLRIKGERHADVERAGIALFAVRGNARELHAVVAEDLAFPHLLIKSLCAAMEMVRAVVCQDFIGFAVDFKLRSAQAVADTADGRAPEAAEFLIALHVLVTHHNVEQFAGFVRHDDLRNRCAVVRNGGIGAVRIFDLIK